MTAIPVPRIRGSAVRLNTVPGLLIGLTALTGVAAVAVAAGLVSSHGATRIWVIALLAIGMGLQNATVRRLALPDLTTTVLTMTLTGLAADSPVAGGSNPRLGRRLTAVAAMIAGAVAGASLMRGAGFATTLAVLAGLYAVIAFGFTLQSEEATS